MAGNNSFQSLFYQWDADGLLQVKEDRDLNIRETYQHDELQRLKAWEVIHASRTP